MQFSKLFGVTLLAMASFGQAQTGPFFGQPETGDFDLDPAPPLIPPPQCTTFRKYSGYIPRLSPQSDEYWVNDEWQGAFETIMASESCPAVNDGKIAWNTGAIGTYLKSIPTPIVAASNEWKEYTKYYQTSGGSDNPNFHIDWVDAAFNCDTTAGFGGPSAAFDPDFSTAYCNGGSDPSPLNTNTLQVVAGSECVGIEESVKKATSYVFQFIEVVQLLEAAIKVVKANTDCIYQRDINFGFPLCEDAIEFWDAAAAIFTGSLEGQEGALPGDANGPRVSGKTLYTLGEKRCRNFGTCGPKEGNLGAAPKYNTASINSKIMQFFAAGSHAAYSGDYRRMEYFKRQISAKIMVPWTQGVFRYAYRLSSLGGSSETHKEIAEANTFALGALPKLWACSIPANDKVAKFFKTGRDYGVGAAEDVDFLTIKAAFECNYACLGITCEEVGSLFDVDFAYDSSDELTTEPKPGAEACDDRVNLSGAKEVYNCVKPNKAFNRKCKTFVGRSGISGRTKREYFFDL